MRAAVGDSVGAYSRPGRESVEQAENELQTVGLGGGDGAVQAANTVPSTGVAVLPARFEDLVVDLFSVAVLLVVLMPQMRAISKLACSDN